MPSIISVIDDDASVRAATENLLSSHGYTVYTFASAEEFLQSARLGDTSCVVSDVQMAGMSGLDLLSHMRVQGYNVPFIIITAFPEERIGSHALAAGAVCSLAKPFSASSLIKCVETAVRRPESSGQNG